MIDEKHPEPYSKKWKEEGCVVEIDTDGILVDDEPNIDEINKFISDMMLNEFGIEDSTLEMEKERFERGLIHKKKNYILIEKDKEGRLTPIIHGAYFTSSRAPRVYDDAVQLIVKYVMDDEVSEEEIRSKALDIRHRPIEDFVMRMRMSKNIDEYKVSGSSYVVDSNDSEEWGTIMSEGRVSNDTLEMSGSQVVSIALQMKNITGKIPEKGAELKYVISIDFVSGNTFHEYFNSADEEIIKRLSYEGYESMIKKLMDATDIATFRKTRKEENWLEDFLDD